MAIAISLLILILAIYLIHISIKLRPYNQGPLWESMNGISFTYINKILEPSVMGSFYSEGLNRACILKDRKLKIYFSANDAFKTYIGLLENEKDDENNISFKFTTNKRHRNTVSLVRYVFAKKWLSAKFIAKRYSVLLSNKLNFKQRT